MYSTQQMPETSCIHKSRIQIVPNYRIYIFYFACGAYDTRASYYRHYVTRGLLRSRGGVQVQCGRAHWPLRACARRRWRRWQRGRRIKIAAWRLAAASGCTVRHTDSVRSAASAQHRQNMKQYIIFMCTKWHTRACTRMHARVQRVTVIINNLYACALKRRVHAVTSDKRAHDTRCHYDGLICASPLSAIITLCILHGNAVCTGTVCTW